MLLYACYIRQYRITSRVKHFSAFILTSADTAILQKLAKFYRNFHVRCLLFVFKTRACASVIVFETVKTNSFYKVRTLQDSNPWIQYCSSIFNRSSLANCVVSTNVVSTLFNVSARTVSRYVDLFLQSGDVVPRNPQLWPQEAAWRL